MTGIVLKPGREKSILRHHPWVFSGAIFSEGNGDEEGEIALLKVSSWRGEVLGWGVYSPKSQIRVRMISYDAEVYPEDEFVAKLVKASCSRRIESGALAADKAACRLINAENDFLPGVIADFYSGFIVCQFTSALGEFWKNIIAKTLFEYVPGCKGVAERIDADARRREGLKVADEGEEALKLLEGDMPPKEIEIEENQVKFLIDPYRGHKTGFYLDQREARKALAAYAKGRDVLNAFSYSGGFGLYALKNGAASVIQLDASRDALELAKRNFALNFPEGGNMQFIADDVFKYLRKCRDERKTFDLIVLDPPKFAESKSQIMKAARGYKDINLLAMKLLRPGGILASFSCSGAISPGFFDQIIAEAAIDSGRDFQLIERTLAAGDHPVAVTFPEGAYLKGVILRCII